ncbi:MAG: FkbM family methyltransferase, partial [Verrucomicrobiia bacterium]
FGQRSRDYIGYSIANKMPECLASGTPIIAYGPSDVATIDYLKWTNAALIVDQQNRDLLVLALQGLVNSRPQQLALGKIAREVAFQRHNLWEVSAGFRKLLSDTVEGKQYVQKHMTSLLGPFERSDSAHWDETLGVAEIFSGRPVKGSMMIDVGGHHGSALMPFLNKGWKIFAFEPDEKNRAQLLERLAKHKNKALVTLDTRCVSNKSQKGLSFFTSEQSTGISGLSAFHESHIEVQKVDTTTLTEFFQDKPLPEVDFLKIDTEGHDLFVLQGFPWVRGKPAVIECEFEDTKTVPLGYTFHDMAKFLVDKGYTVYVSEWHPIVRYGIRHDWRQLMHYPCELADLKGWGNLLAFREPIDGQALVAAVKKVLKVGAGETAQKAAKPAVSAKPAAALLPATIAPLSGALWGFRVEPGPNFAPVAPNQWRYTHSDAKQKLWVAAVDAPGPTAGRRFVACLRVQSDRAMKVVVSLGRHGNSEYEGTNQRITLAPGVAQSVKLGRRFDKAHAALKLQVEVVDLSGGGSAVITIDGLGVTESLTSIRDRLGAEKLNLRTANRLFREGDFATALGIYLWLGQQRPMTMYGDNAVRAAKRVGMPWVKAAEDVAWVAGSGVANQF